MTLITAILTLIQSACQFLFNHTLKLIYLDASSDPQLRFENNKKEFIIKACDTSSLERTLEQRISIEMQPEWNKYAPKDLDLFQNPWLTVQNIEYNARTLNSCKSLYLKSKERFLLNTLNSEIFERRWQPIDLFIVNTGSIATKSMTIKITGVKNLYPGSKVESKTGIGYQPPTGAEKFDSNIWVGLDFYLKKFEYKYLAITNEHPLPDELKYELSEPIRQGRDNKYKLDTFYIDVSKPIEIQLEWNIYEDTLGKRGSHGILKIKCI